MKIKDFYPNRTVDELAKEGFVKMGNFGRQYDMYRSDEEKILYNRVTQEVVFFFRKRNDLGLDTFTKEDVEIYNKAYKEYKDGDAYRNAHNFLKEAILVDYAMRVVSAHRKLKAEISKNKR